MMGKEKKPVNKKLWILLAVLIIFIIILVSNSDFQEGVQDGINDATEETSFNFERVDNENLIKLLNDVLKSNAKYRENLEVDFLASNNTVKVIYTMKDFWNEEELVKKCLNDFCNYGTKVFQSDEINSLEFYIKAKLIDDYGNSEEIYVIKLGINKDEFERINLENLEYQPIYDALSNSCYLFDLHSTLKNIDTSKIYYVAE